MDALSQMLNFRLQWNEKRGSVEQKKKKKKKKKKKRAGNEELRERLS